MKQIKVAKLGLLALLPAIIAPARSMSAFKSLNSQSVNWCIVSSNPNKMLNLVPSTQHSSETTRRLEVTPVAVSSIRLVYANWYGSQFNGSLTEEMPNSNQITIKASIQIVPGNVPQNDAKPQTIIPVTFGGNTSALVSGGDTITSDSVAVNLPKNAAYYVRTFVSSACPAAPAAPVASGSGTNGTLAPGAYTVCVTSLFPNGVESLPSPGTTVSIEQGQTISVQPPLQPSGSTGYRVYVSQAGVSSSAFASISTSKSYSASTLVAVPQASIEDASLRVMTPGAVASYPAGSGVLGGTGPGSSNNGEGIVTGADADDSVSGIIYANTTNGAFGPVAIQGQPVSGSASSIALVGDSIGYGNFDGGYGGNRGGYMTRLVANEYGVACTAFPTPTVGHLLLSQFSAKSSDFAGAICQKNSNLATLCSTVLCDLGLNDVGVGSVPLIQTTLTLSNRYTSLSIPFVHTTLLPRTQSSDGWQSLSGQSVATPSEGFRRQFNNWLMTAQGTRSISNEALYVGSPLARSPSQIVPGISDGTAKAFVPSLPFVPGSEVVMVNGVVQPTSAYEYLYTGSVGGGTYTSGIQFYKSVASGATVTMSYTSMPGFTNLGGSLVSVIDPASAIEVNAQGQKQLNGGWWQPAAPLTQSRSTASSLHGATITDLSKKWTQDQWRGYSVRIFNDPGSPQSTQQVNCITGNSSDTLYLTSSWSSPLPSNQASYQIIHALTQDGTHPTTEGHVLIAKSLAGVNLSTLTHHSP